MWACHMESDVLLRLGMGVGVHGCKVLCVLRVYWYHYVVITKFVYRLQIFWAFHCGLRRLRSCCVVKMDIVQPGGESVCPLLTAMPAKEWTPGCTRVYGKKLLPHWTGVVRVQENKFSTPPLSIQAFYYTPPQKGSGTLHYDARNDVIRVSAIMTWKLCVQPHLRTFSFFLEGHWHVHQTKVFRR